MLNLKLTPEQETFIQEQVGAGRFQDAAELLSTALDLLRQQQMDPDYAAYVSESIRAGVQAEARGEVGELTHGVFEEIKRRGREELAREAQAQQQ